MRALCVTNPGVGHLNPMLPIADALRSAGHEVAFATAPSFTRLVEAEGFRAFPAGIDWLESEAERAFPELADLPLDGRGDFLLRDVFADAAAHRMVPDLLAIASEWRPDVVLRNDYEFGSCVAAERLGVPQATISVCFLMTPGLLAPVIGEQLAYLRSAHGLPPYPSTAMLYPHLYLTYAPPTLEPPVMPQLRAVQPAVRPARRDARADVERVVARLDAMPVRPLVYLSLGTVFNRNVDVFRAMLDGLRDEPVNVLVTVGRNQDPAELGPQAAHVIVERYVPQDEVFPRAALFVTHSPFYTSMSALRFGLPLLMIPLAGDQPAHALRLARHGVGIVLRVPEHADVSLRQTARELSPSSVRDAARALLGDPSYRANVERARGELLALPGPAHAVRLVEEMAMSPSAAHA